MGCCNMTGVEILLCTPFRRHALFGAIGGILVISISLNIFYCVSKRPSGKRADQRKRRSHRQMEDNPIYGNLHPVQTNVDPPQASARDAQIVTSNSQDCYANLSLKPPRSQSGCGSPQTQTYSDVMQLAAKGSEREDEGGTDAASTLSDLYASVQTQRTKTFVPADTGEEYANHL